MFSLNNVVGPKKKSFLKSKMADRSEMARKRSKVNFRPYCACASVDGICREMRPGLCQVRRVFVQKHTFREYYVMFYVSSVALSEEHIYIFSDLTD